MEYPSLFRRRDNCLKTFRFVFLFLVASVLFSCSGRNFIATAVMVYYPGDSLATDTEKFGIDSTDCFLPAVIKSEEPDYPKYIVGQTYYYLEGDVLVKIFISTEGEVKRALILKSTERVFNKPALEAVMNWRFTPAILKGKPVGCWILVPLKFRHTKSEDQ